MLTFSSHIHIDITWFPVFAMINCFPSDGTSKESWNFKSHLDPKVNLTANIKHYLCILRMWEHCNDNRKLYHRKLNKAPRWHYAPPNHLTTAATEDGPMHNHCSQAFSYFDIHFRNEFAVTKLNTAFPRHFHFSDFLFIEKSSIRFRLCSFRRPLQMKMTASTRWLSTSSLIITCTFITSNPFSNDQRYGEKE